MTNKITDLIHTTFPSFDDAHAIPLALTAAYNFDSASDASDKFLGKKKGNIYSRFTNPNVEFLENKISVLEAAEDTVVMSSGMAAYLAIAVCFLEKGDHVILANGIFGTTINLFKKYLEKFDISITVADLTIEKIINEISGKTKLIIIESPTNPLMQTIDIKKLSNGLEEKNIILLVDNTLVTPIFQKPLLQGATLSLNSAGKFFDGLGRCVGGSISGSHEYISQLKMYLRHTGTCISPFNAWILSNSIDTLEVRMLKHVENARKVFKFLNDSQYISKIYSTFFQEATGDNNNGFECVSPLISFEIKGGKESAWNFIDNLILVENCTNIGGSKTMITNSATTTHCRYDVEVRNKLGITDGLLRLCVGLENPNDIINDLHNAFENTFI